MEKVNDVNQQVGGTHYSDMKIEPVVYILANDMDFIEGSVIKYVSRWRKKGGVEDLLKAHQLLGLYIADQQVKSTAS